MKTYYRSTDTGSKVTRAKNGGFDVTDRSGKTYAQQPTLWDATVWANRGNPQKESA